MQATQAEIGDWISQYADEPEKVRAFCVRHDLLKDVQTCVDLTLRHFPPLEKVTMSVYTDQADGRELVRIFAEVRSGMEEALEGDRRFVQAWVAAVPFPRRDRIYFTYTIV